MGAVAAEFVRRLPSKVLSTAWATIGALGAAIYSAAVSTDGTNIYRSHGYGASTVQGGGNSVTPAGVVTAFTNNPPTARQGVAGAFCNGKHYAIGGQNSGGTIVGTNEAYTPAGTNGAAGTWATLTACPVSRNNQTAVAVGNFVYVAGGDTGSSTSGSFDFYRYDTVGGTWTNMGGMPAARTQGAMVAINGKIYYLGGLDTSGTGVRTIYVFDIAAGTWSTSSFTLPDTWNLQRGVAVAIGNVVYYTYNGVLRSKDVTTGTDNTALGGTSHGTAPGLALIGSVIHLVSGSGTANVDALDIGAATELAGSPSPYQRKLRALRAFLAAADPIAYAVACRIPETMPVAGWSTIGALTFARQGAGVSTDGTRIYVSHGYGSSAVQNSGFTVTPTGVVTAMTNSANQQRYGGSSVFCNGKHYVIGGAIQLNSGTASNVVEAYTPAGTNGAGGTWATMATLPFALYGTASAAIGNFIYTAGGQYAANDDSNQNGKFMRYDITANTWSTLANMPAARTQGALVAIGTKLYYLSGTSASVSANAAVYIYDTVAGTWSTGTSLSVGYANLTAAVVNGLIYLVSPSELRTYDPTSGTTSAALSAYPTAHGSNPGAVAIGTSVYAVSGGSTANVDKLDPVSPLNYQRDVGLVKQLALAGPA